MSEQYSKERELKEHVLYLEAKLNSLKMLHATQAATIREYQEEEQQRESQETTLENLQDLIQELQTKLDAAEGIAAGAEAEKRVIERQYEALKTVCASCKRRNNQLQHQVNELEAKLKRSEYGEESAREDAYEQKKIVDALVSLARRIV